MIQKRNLFEELKHQVQNGTMTNRLIIINVAVFALIHILFAIAQFSGAPGIGQLIDQLFTLNASIKGVLYMPWGLLTSIFAHFDIWHIFSNMIFLYFAGNLFERYFNSKMLLITYLFGGLTGGIAEIISATFTTEIHTVLGASGSVMAIFTALAFYSPNTKIYLFGTFPVRLFVLALFFLATDLIGIGNTNDHVAHFAHLGGALFGLLAMQNLNTPKNLLSKIDILWQKGNAWFKKISRPRPKGRKVKTDEEYNFEKTRKQEKTDRILDKISKSGYDSLNKDEKDFLFNQSKNA